MKHIQMRPAYRSRYPISQSYDLRKTRVHTRYTEELPELDEVNNLFEDDDEHEVANLIVSD